MNELDHARILVVDDEVPLMKALCDTLRERGYETVGCTDGRTALAALREKPFDLLLADLSMPDVDGITLLRSATEADPHLVGIIMTGQGAVDTAVEAMKSGALDYIQKPFKLNAITPVLNRALSVRHLRKNNAELEESIRQRTDELEAANRELEAFTYSVSHDLRAPLRALTSYASILMEDFHGELPEEAQDLLDRISNSAQRMNQLIDDLLRFSRLTQQPLEKVQIDTNSLVAEVLDEVRRKDPDRSVSVALSDLQPCFGDPALLRQVYANLLSNAFKFTRRQNESHIEIGSTPGEDGIVYFVRDNGAGFDMKFASKLFGVFQRLHARTEFEGSGIGLSIVHRIITRHGGRIWADGAVDEGATFYFVLPPEDGVAAM